MNYIKLNKELDVVKDVLKNEKEDVKAKRVLLLDRLRGASEYMYRTCMKIKDYQDKVKLVKDLEIRKKLEERISDLIDEYKEYMLETDNVWSELRDL